MTEKLSDLDQFIVAYHAAMEAKLETIGRSNFPFHGDSTPLVYTFRCKDEIATFYTNVDDHPWVNTPPGYRVYDESEWTLDLLCQACSFNRLRVLDPQLGDVAYLAGKEPPEIANLPERAKAWMINHTFVEDSIARRDAQTPFPIVGVSPNIRVAEGIRTAVLPARVRLWSPVVSNTAGIRFRYFQWTYADFWWLSDKLNLNPSRADDIAESDLRALLVLSEAPDGFLAAERQANSSESAANKLEKQCEEFLDLLGRLGHREEEIHRLLAKPNHRIFLDPAAVSVRSKVPFGNKISDFVVERSGQDYTLVEIEPATTPIVKKSDGEPTHEFNHAQQQVRDWQRYIRENLNTVRSELDLPGISEPKGTVIIGRRAAIQGKEAELRWKDIRTTHPLDILTYDDLLDRARATAESFRQLYAMI